MIRCENDKLWNCLEYDNQIGESEILEATKSQLWNCDLDNSLFLFEECAERRKLNFS
jgi:hypothetical protein